MAQHSTSARQQRDPAIVFRHLIPDCHLLDDWLVWMEDACSHRIGGGGLAALSFLHRAPSLPCIGNSFGPDGDDGFLIRACQFLSLVIPRIADNVRPFLIPLTIPGLVYSRRLLRFCGDPSTPQAGWSIGMLTAELSASTAHEATIEWLKRFRSLILEAFSELAAPEPIRSITPLVEKLPAFFQRLVWNSRFAAELLAGMERERRGLHSTQHSNLTCDAGSGDDYFLLWRPAQRPCEFTERDASSLSQMAVDILNALQRANGGVSKATLVREPVSKPDFE